MAGLDLVLHGAILVLVEFGAGVAIPMVLGGLFLTRGHILWQFASGVYLLLLGFNYVPLLWEAIDLTRKQEELAALRTRVAEDRDLAARYTRRSITMLLPLILPILWVLQLRQKDE
jgi:hypothetical protein